MGFNSGFKGLNGGQLLLPVEHKDKASIIRRIEPAETCSSVYIKKRK